MNKRNSAAPVAAPTIGTTARQRRFRLAGATLPLAALLSGFLASGPALADYGWVHVSSLNHNKIEVESDGANYTAPAIPLTQIKADTHLKLDARTSGRVKSYTAWLTAQAENGVLVSFKTDGVSETYSLGSRPKSVDKHIDLRIPYGSLAPFAAGHCNKLANQLRSAGETDEEIFGQDRNLEVEVLAALQYDMSGIPSTSEPDEFIEPETFSLVCKKAPPVPTDPERTRYDVIDADLSIVEQSGVNGTCRLNLSGAIETRNPNTEVDFRFQTSFETNGGTTSAVKTVTTDHSNTALFNYPYDLPGGGQKSGQIRILADGYTSAWADFDMTCFDNADDLKTAMPPKAHIETSVAEVKLINGMSCPTKIWLAGHIEGRGDAEGFSSFVGPGFLSGFHPYSVSDGETDVVLSSLDLEWKGAARQSGKQEVRFGFNVASSQGNLIASVRQQDHQFGCTVAKIGKPSPGLKGAAQEQAQEEAKRGAAKIKTMVLDVPKRAKKRRFLRR